VLQSQALETVLNMLNLTWPCTLIVSRQHKAPRQETLKHEIRTFDQLRQTPQTNSNAVTSIKIPTSEKREIAKKHFIQKKT